MADFERKPLAKLTAGDVVAEPLSNNAAASVEVAGLPDQDAQLCFRQAVDAEVYKMRVWHAAKIVVEAERSGPARPFEWGLLADLEEADVPPFRIEGLLPADGGMVIVAQRKTGKTSLVLNLARSLIGAEPFLGSFSVPYAASGPVAILNYEVSGGQLQRWARQTGIPEDQLFLVNLRGRRNPLAHKADRQALADKLRDVRAETLIVDPFGRAYSGNNQNDSGEVGAWLNDLDVFARQEAGVAEVILTVHAGWKAERTRGASAIEDWGDSIVTMTLGADGETRFLRAIGRDVSVDEDRLSYDRETRMLTMTGSGSRSDFDHAGKALALVEPVCQYIGKNPGANQTSIRNAIRERRQNGELATAFQDVDVRKAIQMALDQKRIRREDQGSGKSKKHYLVDLIQENWSEPNLDKVT